MWQIIAILCVFGVILLWALAKFQKDGKEKHKMSFAGALIVLLLVSLYFSNSKDENNETALAHPQNTPPPILEKEGGSVVASEEITIDDFTFKNFTLKEIKKSAWSGAVEVMNNSKLMYKTVLFSVLFYDKDGHRIGIGHGSISKLKPGESKTDSFYTADDLSSVSNYKYQIDIATDE